MKKIVVPFSTDIEKLSSGEKITLPPFAAKTQKHLSFTCDISDIGEGKITVGHGYEVSGASWVEITADEIKAFAYYTYTDPKCRSLFAEPIKHGLKVRDFVSVVIDVNPHERGAFLIVSTSSGMIKTEMNGWDGNDGEIFAQVDGISAENCKLNWFSDGFSHRIWILGDSYCGFGHPARWPYYLYRDGYNNHFISGFPGMPAESAIEQFRRFVDRGAPEFVVWTLGMNNEDKDGKMSESYLRSTEEFIAICLERGITPILSTIPNVPGRDNSKKNEWVRSQPYRYIDFARAVGSEKTPEWYPGMLSADMVHPSDKGAEALYMQVLCDFPEIMQRSNT
ncbi:MAG: SGNH/GDSL hydrolase family protein [Clostridia bacterium]|nr:SGNH/GDSL hydrolase family protein [Clostridia bacterium]